MKEMTIPTRMYMFVSNLLDALIVRKKPSTQLQLEYEPDHEMHRSMDRKDFPYYMPLINYETLELVGHLTDISSGGFKLDSENPLPVNKEFRLRMDLNSEVSKKPFMVFVARSRWCQIDPYDPFCFNVGFQLVDISPGDLEIFSRMIEKYGKKRENRRVDLRRTNMW